MSWFPPPLPAPTDPHSLQGSSNRSDLTSRPFSPTAIAATRTVSSPSAIKTIYHSLGRLRTEYNFIPRDKLDELLDEGMVLKILHEIVRSKHEEGQLQAIHFEPEKVYQWIYKNYRVILAILIDIR
ncbi:hypothetical protein K440DRAFT_159355 [Wilcoxina mikolae CBS 423.85]|nr:hypothetical protein K440DRAFT_159355 [Wilcoxina mikolae CBS 423.85]